MRWLVFVGALTYGGCYAASSISNPDLSASVLVSSSTNVALNDPNGATVTVYLRRQDGTPVSGLTVRVACDGCLLTQPQGPSDAEGRAVACVRSATAGERTVTASASLQQFSGVVPATTSINFLAAGSTVQALPSGSPLTVQVTMDSNAGLPDASYRGTVHFSSSDPDATLPGDYTFTAADAGSHVFVGQIVLVTPGVQTVTMTDVASGRVLEVETFTVVGVGPHISVMALAAPSQTAAGSAVPITLTRYTATGQVDVSYSGTVHFGSSDPAAMLPAPYTFAPTDAGSKDFAVALTLSGNATLTVTDDGGASAVAALQVTPGPLTTLDVEAQPAPCGESTAFSVRAYDGYDNLKTDYVGTLHLSSTDTEADLPADTAVGLTDAGMRAMDAVFYQTGAVTLTATDVASNVSGQVLMQMAPSPLAGFLLTTPHGMPVGAPVGVTISAVDANNQVLPGYLGTVTLTSSDANATLHAPLLFTAESAGTMTVPAAVQFATAGVQTLTVTDAQWNKSGSGNVLVNAPWITSILNQTLCVDGNAQVTLQPCDRAALSQQWQVMGQQLRQGAGLCLQGNTVNKTLTVSACNASDANQQFTYNPNTHRFVNVAAANNCVDLANAHATVGTPIWLVTCHLTGAEVWPINQVQTLRSQANTAQCINTDASGVVTNVQNCNTTGATQWIPTNGQVRTGNLQCLRTDSLTDGTVPTLGACDDGNATQWAYEPTLMRLQNLNVPSKCLSSDGNALTVQDCLASSDHTLSSQQWLVGSVVLSPNAAPTLCVEGAGNTMALAACNGASGTQHWSFFNGTLATVGGRCGTYSSTNTPPPISMATCGAAGSGMLQTGAYVPEVTGVFLAKPATSDWNAGVPARVTSGAALVVDGTGANGLSQPLNSFTVR